MTEYTICICGVVAILGVVCASLSVYLRYCGMRRDRKIARWIAEELPKRYRDDASHTR